MLDYEDSQLGILGFLGRPGGPGGFETRNVKGIGFPTLCLSEQSIGSIWSPYFVGIPRLSRVEGRGQKDV